MKKIIASTILVISLWSSMISPTEQQPLSTPPASRLQLKCSSEDIATFIAEHKKELAVLAAAITIGLSLKYCSWVQGLVGIDTEDEIDDWRVFIQK